jgi:hypothetical protein
MRMRIYLVLLAATPVLACSSGEAGAASAAAERGAAEAGTVEAGTAERGLAEPQEVVVRTFDHGFAMPDTITSGPTTIRLVNDGPDFHHVWLIRLEEGGSVEALMTELAAHRPLPTWAVAVGGPNTPGVPGGETSATLDLEPGEYVVACVIPGMHDGELHVAKGMVRTLTVVPAQRAARMPEAELVITLADYSYHLSRPVTRGSQSIKVVNAAAQPHEVVVVKLEPGRTAHDFLTFLQQPAGAPPGTMIGGVTWLSQGESNVITLEFEEGDYALLCFVPDEGDGQLHLAHGMVREFRVE